MDPSNTTITAAEMDRLFPCEECGRRREQHMDDGKCLFEASSFRPKDWSKEIVQVATWTYTLVEPVKPPRPYPQPTLGAQRKEQRLKIKAQMKGNRRR